MKYSFLETPPGDKNSPPKQFSTDTSEARNGGCRAMTDYELLFPHSCAFMSSADLLNKIS